MQSFGVDAIGGHFGVTFDGGAILVNTLTLASELEPGNYERQRPRSACGSCLVLGPLCYSQFSAAVIPILSCFSMGSFSMVHVVGLSRAPNKVALSRLLLKLHQPGHSGGTGHAELSHGWNTGRGGDKATYKLLPELSSWNY